jgi:hypothetical protein
MFANRYFNPRYFADRYWGTGEGAAPIIIQASEYLYAGIGWRYAALQAQALKDEAERRKRRKKRQKALILARLLLDS